MTELWSGNMFQYHSDNKLVQTLEICADVLWLTVLWLLLCIPVITAGASCAARDASMLALAERRGGGVTRGFLRRFLENLRQASAAWLIMLAAGGLLLLDSQICWSEMHAGPLSLVLRCTTLALCLCGAMVAVWLFAGIGRFYSGLGQAFRNAILWAALHWRTTICLLLLEAAWIALAVLLWWYALIPAGFFFYLRAKLLSRVFAGYTPAL